MVPKLTLEKLFRFEKIVMEVKPKFLGILFFFFFFFSFFFFLFFNTLPPSPNSLKTEFVVLTVR